MSVYFEHGTTTVEFDDLLRQAVREDREVHLEAAGRYGYHFVVDGVALPGGRDGFPLDALGMPLADLTLGDDAEPLCEDLASNYQSRRTQRRNESAETSNHASAEGCPDPGGDTTDG